MRKIPAILILCVMLCGCSPSTDNARPEPEPETELHTTAEIKKEAVTERPTEPTTTEIATSPEENPIASAVTEPEAEESCISIVSYHISKDYSGDPVLVIEYAFTNTDDDPSSFTFSVQDSVFQNGIECSTIVLGCDEVDSQQQLNDVQPGFTYNLKVGYILQDMSPATVIVTDLWGDTTYIEEEIDLGGVSAQETSSTNISAEPLKINNCFLSKDYQGADVLVVEYQFTNIESEPESFLFEFDDTAFQNGIECSNNVFGCDEVDSSVQLSEIQPGVSITVPVGYLIQDMSDVNIIVTKLFSSEEVLNETIYLR